MNEKLNIRKLKVGDEQAVSRICRRCLKEINSKDMSKEQVQFLLDYFSVKNIKNFHKEIKVFVVLSGEKIVGTGSLSGDHIRAVFVNPSYHGKGIGAKLVKHLEKVIKKAGYSSVLVRSSRYAVGFYNKLGYKKVKTINIQEVGEVTVMKKIIK